MSIPRVYSFNLLFKNPHYLQLKSFVVSNKNFYPLEVKTGILQKRKYDFSFPYLHFVIKSSNYTYRRKLILDLNERWELVLLIHEKKF